MRGRADGVEEDRLDLGAQVAEERLDVGDAGVEEEDFAGAVAIIGWLAAAPAQLRGGLSNPGAPCSGRGQVLGSRFRGNDGGGRGCGGGAGMTGDGVLALGRKAPLRPPGGRGRGPGAAWAFSPRT